MTAATAPARPAATVVLCRPGAPFEVFFVRRHRQSGFMAGAWVFPGGRVDESDHDPELARRVDGLDPAALLARMAGLGGVPEAIAHVVAAIRETFEEAGLLLATASGGAPLDPGDAALRAAIDLARERQNAGSATFADMVRDLDLRLDARQVRYLAHWVTPEVEPRRYDTRFFLARAPEGQEGLHDGRETTDSVWRSPAGALAEHAAGRFPLAPPTWRLLRDLARAKDLEEASSIAPPGLVVPVMPIVALDDGRLVIALPGDPLHPDSPPGATAPVRAVLRDGVWATE